jgi:phospholipid/cholesterol/gamma-HCH transport system permease protein
LIILDTDAYLTQSSYPRNFLIHLGSVGILTRDFFRYLFRRPFEPRLFIEQLDSVGVRSLNIVNLTAIFTGMVLSLQLGNFLTKFGAKIYVSRVIGMTLFRELGPVLTALMIGGRVGAGIAAELGSMKVTDQIDAMRSLAFSPTKELVVPRVFATILMLPLLTMISDAVGFLGALLIATTQLGLNASFFYNSMFHNLKLGDVFTGLGKAGIFGYLIAIVACYRGLDANGGADGVGRATTTAVVAASISVLVADFFLSKLFIVLKV